MQENVYLSGIHLLRKVINVATHNHNVYIFSEIFCLMKRIHFLSPCVRGYSNVNNGPEIEARDVRQEDELQGS
jgi:hypothetical protein